MQLATSQIGKLIRLLGSDKDGEVVATARALGRTLKATGRDWHDLADVAERYLARPTIPVRPPWQMLAQECLRQGGAYRLKAGERQFLVGMTNWTSEPSERQWAWLRAIAAALGVEGRAAA
jgi:hypothetical protein